MRKYIILSILLAIPLQGFCDRYLVSNKQNVNQDIQTIEKDGGLIKEIKTTRLNDSDASYTIIYTSGSDFRDMTEALREFGDFR